MPVKKRRAARATLKKSWKPSFIAALAGGATVSDAAAECLVDRATVYRHLKTDKEFAAAFVDAEKQSADALEREARRRATQGVDKVKLFMGQPVYVPVDKDGKMVSPNDSAYVQSIPLIERDYSDTLLIFLMKARNPQVFGDKVHHTSDGSFAEDQVVLVHSAPPAPAKED